MIKIIQLYKSSNRNYDFNGDFNLDNIISSLSFEGGIKNIHTIEIVIEFDEEGKWKNIDKWDVIKCDTPMQKDQLFRVYDTDTTDSDLTINIRPLFYDLSKKVILDSRNVNSNGQAAIDKALSGTDYTGHSNISKRGNCNWVKKNIVAALFEDQDYSFINNYGGELWIDNFDITINDRIGGDYGVQCSYGKDISSIEKNINTDSIYTRLIPYGHNNLMLPEIYVDSPLVNNYPFVQELPISMDDIAVGEEEGEFATETLASEEMRRRCLQMFTDGLDKPLSNFKISIESLEGSNEYKDFKDLVTIGIGDTVRVYYKPLNIDLNVRCLNIKADYIITKNVWEYTDVELGDYIEDYDTMTNNTSSIANNANNKIESITDGDNIIAEKVKGLLDATKTSLNASKQIGDKQDYRIALAEDLDPESPTYGAMLWGSGRIFLANKRTLDNKDWDYSTAITPDGIVADTLVGRLLASIDGACYFDLDNGLIKGKDLSIDLTNGIINFTKGLIKGKNSSWNLDTGEINLNNSLNFDGTDLEINGKIKNSKDSYGVEVDKGGVLFKTGNEIVGGVRSSRFRENNAINGVSIVNTTVGDYIDLGYSDKEDFEGAISFYPVIRVARIANELMKNFKGIQFLDNLMVANGKILTFETGSEFYHEVFNSTTGHLCEFGDNGMIFGYKNGNDRVNVFEFGEETNEYGAQFYIYKQLSMTGKRLTSVDEIYKSGNSIRYLHEGWVGSIEKTAKRISNLNVYYDSGWYAYGEGANGAPSNYGIVLHFKWGETDFVQLAMDFANTMYQRAWVNGAWTSWKSR